MKRPVLRMIANTIGMGWLSILAYTYAKSYFVNKQTIFCVNYNAYGEGAVEFIIFIVGICLLAYFTYQDMKKS
jgi:hypothetical protein